MGEGVAQREGGDGAEWENRGENIQTETRHSEFNSNAFGVWERQRMEGGGLSDREGERHTVVIKRW